MLEQTREFCGLNKIIVELLVLQLYKTTFYSFTLGFHLCFYILLYFPYLF